jgi:hypothetical protein
MTKGAYTLSDIDWPVVRLYCPQCHRFAQFRRAVLVKRFGPDKVMPSMLWDLKPCDIGNSLSGPRCQLGYWDRMTDQARAKAIDRGGLQRAGLSPSALAPRRQPYDCPAIPPSSET